MLSVPYLRMFVPLHCPVTLGKCVAYPFRFERTFGNAKEGSFLILELFKTTNPQIIFCFDIF